MPKRTDIHRIMILGSGPIVIGQACEFDYSGTQAVKALKEEGYEVHLVNSNPATIMTDPDLADRTYIEPITPRMVEKILAESRPQALLPTLGGQTALNCALKLAEHGTLERYGVELIGASTRAIKEAEDRALFRKAMEDIGLDVPRSGVAKSLEEAWAIQKEIGYPVIIRPSFTLGGTGGSIAYNRDEFAERVNWALDSSPEHSTLLEESVLGWKEFELEVMRDRADNVVIICSIENLDPMGVHTGDSITVAPAQTLTDKEYQKMRDAALRIIRRIGVDTGGCNIQFGVDPSDGRLVVIEMNPRVSRSSALASKATGFAIAKIAAKLAVGYTLDEIRNDITRTTPASFEPSIDYVVTKIPRFAFEKFPGTDRRLTTQMKSVGEVMGIGRTFQESLGKAVRSLELGNDDLEAAAINKAVGHPIDLGLTDEGRRASLLALMAEPGPERLWVVAEAMRVGVSDEEIFQKTKIDRWFLSNIREMMETEAAFSAAEPLTAEDLVRAKRAGLSDRRLARLRGLEEREIRALRGAHGIVSVMKRVDTCAGEFAAETPYMYSAYEEECEARPSARDKIVILGSGPNRIGQGIEFDYCCVHAVMGLKEDGFETIMVNCNPETVSTDYDTADRLYFEPLTTEDVFRIVEIERPLGVIVQFGGQTPLKLSGTLSGLGVKILGTPPDAIDRAEDRERFAALVRKLGLRQPENGLARSLEQAAEEARRIGYPVLVRPSYVLGGRAMEICHDEPSLLAYMQRALDATPDIERRPVLIDRYLDQATEFDVDALSDGDTVVIAGILEHIEEAGVHSGDSGMAMPPHSVSPTVIEQIEVETAALARELGVVGLMNVQFALQHDALYVLEVNPRASRTVPFISKATGVPLAKIAARLMAGKKLVELGLTARPPFNGVAVKESVFPFVKFPNADTVLGPEMKSTGEVMGIDTDFARAFAKATLGAGMALPESGRVFVSVSDPDKPKVVGPIRRLVAMGFEVLATGGTAAFLEANGIEVERVNKVAEGRPHVVDSIVNGDVDLVFNTSAGKIALADSFSIRRQALMSRVPYFTTTAAMAAATGAIEALCAQDLKPRAIQEYHQRPARPTPPAPSAEGDELRG
ncbi:MAG: carbamoyl-phosphate synthase large subunit [Deltaproteobacteria bacterium]|nr:carbamoyl-phosphate synthase large subunit [Deltaproteobacteria bacterium]